MINTLLPFLMLGILAATLLARPLARIKFLPLPVALVALGFISSEAWVYLGFDTGLRWEILRDLVFYLLLPILIFESALNINTQSLKRDGLIIGALAIPLLIIAAAGAAAVFLWLAGDRIGGSWLLAIMAGSMICATDPASVSNILRALGVPDRTVNILEGESLFNDGTTITLFVLLSALILQPGAMIGTSDVLLRFSLTFFGGFLVGAVLGRVFDWFIRPLDDTVLTGAATLVLAFTSFWAAEHLLGVSGVVSTLAAGLTIAWCERKHRSDEDIAFARRSWRLLNFCAEAMLFMLVGMSVTINMFREHWPAMLAGVAAAILSRALIVYLGAGPVSRLPGQQPLSFNQQNLILWGGIRGAVAIALAVSLDINIPHWYTIQSTIYGVALFSMLVQPPLLIATTRQYKPSASTNHQQ